MMVQRAPPSKYVEQRAPPSKYVEQRAPPSLVAGYIDPSKSLFKMNHFSNQFYNALTPPLISLATCDQGVKYLQRFSGDL